MSADTSILKKSLIGFLSVALVIGFVPFEADAFAFASSQSLSSLKQSLDVASSEMNQAKGDCEKARESFSSAEAELSDARAALEVARNDMKGSRSNLEDSIASASSSAQNAESFSARALASVSSDYDQMVSSAGADYNASDVEDISKSIAAKEDTLSSAKAAQSRFQSERDSHISRCNECSSKISSLKRDIEEIEGEIEELQWEKLSSEMESAQQEYDLVKNAFDAARARKSEASAQVTKYSEETGKIYAEQLAADTTVRSTKSEMDSAQKAYDDYRASIGATGEQKIISLKEYLSFKMATSALSEFDYRQGYTGEAKDVTAATQNETANDATDYRNVLRALETIKKTNEVRKSLGLSELLVSDRLMAKETVSANWSATNLTHSDGCGAENLYWGKGGENGNPVEMWYDYEKAIYEKALETNMYEDQQLPEGWQYMSRTQLGRMGYYDFTSNIGHYFNLIAPEHLYIGAAVNNMPDTHNGTVWGQLYSSGEIYSDAVPVEQWESEFLDWVNTQLDARPDVSLFAQYEQAKADWEAAKRYSNAQVLRQEKNNELLAAARENSAAANAAFNEISPVYKEALAAYQPVKDAYDAAKESYDPLASELSRLEESLSSLTTEKEVFEARIEALDKEIEYCDETVSRTDAELEALKEESTIAYAIAEKAKEVSAAQAAYDKAASDLAYITSFDTQGALAGNGKKTNISTFASLDADIATCAVKTAAYNKASDKYDSAVATRDAAATRAASAQSEYESALASYNFAKAAYDAACKEASRVSLTSVSATLSADALTYTGSVTTPAVKLTFAGKTLVQGRDYTLSRATACKAIGTHKLTVTGIGQYKDVRTLSFKINPQGATIKKLVAGKGQVAVSLAKKSSNIGGFKIRYSKNKSMSSPKTVSAKKSATSKIIKSLTKNNTYYFQVRTYKKVSGKTYYSAWSAAKSVKVK